MKSAIVPRLVNGPFGDPGLHISLRWQGRAIQFDLGRIGRMNPGELLKVTHVFVTHAHMDHFMGFDHMLRLFLARDAELHMYGPADFLERIRGRLDGYTWNLTGDYVFAITGHEVHEDRIVSRRFPAAHGFRPEDVEERPFVNGVLLDEKAFRVRTAILDHKIPCLAFALDEKTHLNVDKAVLTERKLRPGRWLGELKTAIEAGAPDDHVFDVPTVEPNGSATHRFTLGELRDALILESEGQKIGYVVDVLYSDANRRKIVDLVRGANVFYCEAPFLEEDVDQATKRYHLTAHQAGLLGHEAGARRLEVFHFSPRYDGQADRIYAEARAAFRGGRPRQPTPEARAARQ